MSTGTHLHFEFRFLGEQFDPARVLDLDRYKVKQWRFHIKPGYFLHLAEMRDQPLFYTARKGDQLQRVAALFSLPLAKLLKLNKLDAAAALTEGQRVRVW
jgi:murein DD-endopeptidase MepM/ murein hydrolase activator NlpD